MSNHFQNKRRIKRKQFLFVLLFFHIGLEATLISNVLWYIYTMEYYSAIKKNTFESVLMR